MTKIEVTRWDKMHYRSTYKLVDNQQVGGVVDKTWLIVVGERETVGDGPCVWEWPPLPEITI
jgi:hypothetical protein